MRLEATIRGVRHRFDSVKQVLARANAPRSGDDLAGVSARTAVERVAAMAVLSQLTLAARRAHPGVPCGDGEGTGGSEEAQAPATRRHGARPG